jgi:hypothetical protein
MFPRIVETAVILGCACKRGSADRQIVPATDATAPCRLVFGEESDVAAGLQKAAGTVASVCFLEDEREVYAKLGGDVTEGDKLAPTAGGALIATTTVGDYYVGEAAASGKSGDVIKVIAIPGRLYRPTA